MEAATLARDALSPSRSAVGVGAWVGCLAVDLNSDALSLIVSASRSVVVVLDIDLVVEDCRLAGRVSFDRPRDFVLRSRPLRYSAAGFRKMPVVASIRSVDVPRSEEVMPVTGSQR